VPATSRLRLDCSVSWRPTSRSSTPRGRKRWKRRSRSWS